MSPDGANQYTQAIQSVGEIIEPYDTDKQFPALGFGAKVPPHGQVSFEFFLNMTQNPYCNGVQGILQAYRTALGQVCKRQKVYSVILNKRSAQLSIFEYFSYLLDLIWYLHIS